MRSLRRCEGLEPWGEAGSGSKAKPDNLKLEPERTGLTSHVAIGTSFCSLSLSLVCKVGTVIILISQGCCTDSVRIGP